MLRDEIYDFLTANGFRHTAGEVCGMRIIRVEIKDGRQRIILPVEITARTLEDAENQSDNLKSAIEGIVRSSGCHPVVITEDRWTAQHEMTAKRLLAHLETFFPIYARNCEVRRIEKAEAEAFLKENHSYGDAVCRYRYGLFLKRHTGQRGAGSTGNAANQRGNADDLTEKSLHEIIPPGTMVAVAEFSNARKWQKGDKVIRSYEWTRYASLPDVRINGGMGKMLKHFIMEVQPDDIMSYADLEWSEGRVYEQLGFMLEGHKEAVTFMIDRESGIRRALGKGSFADAQDDRRDAQDDRGPDSANRYFCNLGSNKYRLKLTDYE